MKVDRKYKAITLIETTVYLGLFAVLFATMMNFYFTIGRANQRASMQLKNERISIFLTQHTEDTIRNASLFDELNSTYDTDLSTLRFTYGAGYREYYVTDGVLYVTDGIDYTPLTPDNLVVTKFRGDVSEDSSTLMYRIDLEIVYNDPNFPSSEKTLTLFYIIA